ncbi:MAG: hypothetical protein COV44_02755 [Deltaproteobacteria bacterium CG11_big_fil_rev_8_21_14_0_20_45_16]|nr:MAG: hypothetical protein COV44_02755 [Deltaproteobacteria bacterium CG11_big_fil_rev_8_21_14_0_20_45_16]
MESYFRFSIVLQAFFVCGAVFISESSCASEPESNEPVFIDGTILGVRYMPKIPARIEALYKQQERIQSRGPFNYEPVRPSPVQEAVFFSQFVADYRRLQEINPSTMIKPEEILAAEALSYILAQQVRAASKYPYIRLKRSIFVQSQLDYFAYGLPRMSGRFYFLAQQLSNKWGIGWDWKKIIQVLEKDWREDGVIVVDWGKSSMEGLAGTSKKTTVKIERGWTDRADIYRAFDILSNILAAVRAQQNSSSIAARFSYALESLGLKDAIPQASDYSDLVPSETELSWNYESGRVFLPPNLQKQAALYIKLETSQEPSFLYVAKEIWNQISKNSALDQTSQEVLFHFALSQIGARAGGKAFIRAVDFLDRNKPEGLDLEVENRDPIKIFPNDLKSAHPNQPLSLSILDFLWDDALEQSGAGRAAQVWSASLKKLDEVLKLNSLLFDLVNNAEPYLQNMYGKDLKLRWNFVSVEQNAFEPLAAHASYNWIPESFDAVDECGPCGVVDVLGALRLRLERDYRMDNLAEFELPYHILSYQDNFVVDYDFAPYGTPLFSQIRELEPSPSVDPNPTKWGQIEISFDAEKLPSNYSEFMESVNVQLNAYYLSRIFQKILFDYGLEFDSQYVSDLRRSEPNFQADIKPYYEEMKENYYRDLEAEVVLVRIPLRGETTDEDVKQKFAELYIDAKKSVASQANDLAVEVYDRTNSIEDAKSTVIDRLNSGLREDALYRMRDLILLELSAAFDSGAAVVDRSVMKGNMDRILKDRSLNISLSDRNKVRGVILEYRDSILNNQLMMLPATGFIEITPSGSKNFCLILVNRLKLGEYMSLYDAQLSIREELEERNQLNAVAKMMKRLLEPSIVNFQQLPLPGFENIPTEEAILNAINRDNARQIIAYAANIEHERVAKSKAWNSHQWLGRNQDSDAGGGGLSIPRIR